MSPLWLVGMMGSGKSSSGRIAANALAIDFVDTDEIVERQAGKPITRIFAEEGEGGFRAHESEAVKLAASSKGIVATGGGAVVDPSNRDVISSTGTVVWLDVTTNTALSRLRAETGARPLLAGEDPEAALQELDAERRPLYQLIASHHLICEDRDVETVAAEIEAIWRS